MKTNATPPNLPWKDIVTKNDAGGYLSIYYSEDLSPLPIRWISKLGDNKSDPNLETMTYGLFSTCSKSMRSGAVKRGAKYIFFATRREDTRVLTGYYHLKWYAPTPQDASDVCLAADRIHFVQSPLPLAEVDDVCSTDVSNWFRNMRVLTAKEAQCMAKLLDEKPDATDEYLEEIDRLERFNLHYGGYRYVGWKRKDKFSWDAAREYLVPEKKHSSGLVKNATPSNQWKCIECGGVVNNKALLKRCPECAAIGSLREV